MQLASTSTPRSATSSVTCSYDSGYRRYQRTHKTITSPGCWRPLNGLCGLIGMDFYPIRMPAPEFATEPGRVYQLWAIVISEDDGVEVLGAGSVASDDKSLPLVYAHLLPSPGALTRFVTAVETLRH